MSVRILSTQESNFRRQFAAIRRRGEEATAPAEAVARDIVAAVRQRGDRAVLEYTKRFDGVTLRAKDLRVPPAEIEAALTSLPAEAVRAMRLAARRIAAFHRKQIAPSWSYADPVGLRLGQAITPLRSVGLYVPGGHASYPSSVLMNAIPAKVAGVENIVMVSPAGKGGFNPAVLAAAAVAGVRTIYRVGGAQAVGALAYGTATIPKVDKIVGPGNAYVQAAKKIVYGATDIDKIAGPSEIVVIADEDAEPRYVAADLLAQAEHGSGDECAVLLTPSRALATRVLAEIECQVRALTRGADAARVLKRRGALIVVRDLEEAVELAEEIAPEHLEVLTHDAARWARKIRNSGAIFVGPYAPAPLGDYLAGPNHVLPTGGTARFYSPLGVYDFVKRTSIVTATRTGLRRLAPTVERLASLEGYDAHAAAVRCRFE